MQSILAAKPEQLIEPAKFKLELAFESLLRDPNTRLSIYEPPHPEHEYVLGFDAAYGILQRDYDAIVVLDKDTKPVRQVAEFQGHVGERLDVIAFGLHKYYRDAFIVGERQVGLATLRRLYDFWGVRWLFYDRSEGAQSRRMTDKLGHHRTHDDITLRNLRLAHQQRLFVLRSMALIDQMNKMQFYEPTQAATGERHEDEKLKIKLNGGGSPDLAMALSMAWHGIREVPHFQKPAKPLWGPGTYGEIFEGHDELLPVEQRQPLHQGFENLGRG